MTVLGDQSVPKSDDAARPADAFEIQIITDPGRAEELVLFLTHAPDGRIKPHVPHYTQAFRNAGLRVAVVVVADDLGEVRIKDIAPFCDGLILRQNGGYDFAGWAHALSRIDTAETKLLILANDSMFGPLNDDDFNRLIARVRDSSAELIGMIDSAEQRYHYQSQLLAVRGAGVVQMVDFLAGVRALPTKKQVIDAYELRLHNAFAAAGLSTQALFPIPAGFTGNRTIAQWRALINEGFPFVKTVVIQALPRRDWEAEVTAHGYPLRLIDGSLDLLGGAGGGDRVSDEKKSDIAAVAAAARADAPTRAGSAWRSPGWRHDGPLSNTFKRGFYRLMARLTGTIAPAQSERYKARAERRKRGDGQLGGRGRPSRVGAERIEGALAFDAAKPNVLVVSHEASRSGAPILAHNIARALSVRYNVTVLALTGGDILESYAEVSEQVYHGKRIETRQLSYEALLRRFTRDRSFRFAIVNSIQSRGVLEDLSRADIAAVFLLHEFASYIGDPKAFEAAVTLAPEVVFSTRLTLEAAFDVALPDRTPFMHVLPQGRCLVPAAPKAADETSAASVYARDDEADQLSALMRPAGTKSFVVMGAGTVEYRKGTDLFIETAARLVSCSGMDHVRFVWFGGGYDPDTDLRYSAFLRDQISRSGLEARISLVPATGAIDVAYGLADALLLSSRLDPLPNVAIDAMCTGTPVFSFAEASGISDILIERGLGVQCVADYLDTSQMADKLRALAMNVATSDELSARVKTIGEEAFNFGRYADALIELGERAARRKAHSARDEATIAEAPSFRPDFCSPEQAHSMSRPKLARRYLRTSQKAGWARRPEPGFNPFLYAEARGADYDGASAPYADFLRAGRPEGPWLQTVIDASEEVPRASDLRAALHIHAFFPDQLRGCLDRIRRNASRPTLYVSVADDESAGLVRKVLRDYDGPVAAVGVVPNAGRDIGPLLTHFGPVLIQGHDVVGHIHFKKSAHVENRALVDTWSEFLFEHLLGGDRGGAMIDRALRAFENQHRLGLLSAADPHVIGWTRNLRHAKTLGHRLGLDDLPCYFDFPVGTMFWMRAQALVPFVDLKLEWGDYPPEPLANDGTMLHALERLFGVVPASNGWETAVTRVEGVTR
ncbi:hypothetical protein DKT77_11385 [Meridianimarinicoccus roseus]|uniref:Uncharacterized protein n=1 Tax=Meridianimarinicoccus roseus TaxID=2072018 RepID=A0A2V2LF58_9RHOB|nr:rhamnan synthesis F family protein [Meridianimarinicoccus roseus]PWR02521.1 hypothetical protein DKT77_11385 [Meridianimarinicoccus roseus]